jgi:hypothetical protein
MSKKRNEKITKETPLNKIVRASKPDGKRGSEAFRKTSTRKRRVHVTSALTASEIREALGISQADLEAAREAIAAST